MSVEKSKLRAIFLEHWNLKLLSLAMSIALAVYVRGEKTALTEFPIKVIYLTTEEQVMTSQPPTEISVRVQGPENTLNLLGRERLPNISVDLSTYKENQYCFEYSVENLPPRFRSVRIQSLSPRCVPVVIETKVKKTVPVVVDVVGTPQEGYTLGPATSTPAAVVLEGAESELAKIGQVRTEPVIITKARKTMKSNVKLVAFAKDSSVWYEKNTTPGVEVQVEIIAQNIEKTVRSVRVVTMPNVDSNYRVLPEKIDVVVYGPRAALQSLDAASLRVELSIAEAVSKGITTLTLDLAGVKGLPQDVTAVDFRPTSEVKLYSSRPPAK